jgi:TonB family protein
MKYLLIALCLLISSFVFSGNAVAINDSTELEIYDRAEVMPTFPGGQYALNIFLNKNIRYPIIALENALEGKVIVKFYVDTDGSIKNPIVLKDNVGGGCAEEALRVVGSMPKWNPGTQRNKPVRVFFVIPITFKLTNGLNAETSTTPIIAKAYPLCGFDSLQNYLSNATKVIAKPKKDKKKQYHVQATFTVLADGNISNIVISEITNNDDKIKNAIIDYIKRGPKWMPEKVDSVARLSVQEIAFSF